MKTLTKTKTSDGRRALLALIVVVATLTPFLNKAFHIDDTLYLWMAQQISQHPGDPYGFSVNWNSAVQPMSFVMQNPPFSSYFAAAVATLIGWSELAMHAAFLVPAAAAVLGTFFLARRLCGSPLLAALLMFFTPVFLVSATQIMSDVLLVALWVWSIECWLRGLEKNAWWLLVLASILAAAAALTKYFGISLLPLLAVFTLARERRFTPRLLFLLITIAGLGAYEMATTVKYGQGSFSGAITYPWTFTSTAEKQFFKIFLIGLSFTGGGLIGALFYAPLLKPRKLLIAGAGIFVALLPLFYFYFAHELGSTSLRLAITGEGALFATTGVGILSLALFDVLQRRTADSLLLGLWVIGTFLFATYFLNWSVASRAILPMTPAVAILLVRRFHGVAAGEKTSASLWWPLLPAALISLFVTMADYRLAGTARMAAEQFKDKFRSELGTVWFQGHWGFQYYMEKWGAKPLDVQQPGVFSGDVIIVPINNADLVPLSREHTMDLERVEYGAFPLFTTMTRTTGAGFYSSAWGPLPWALTDVPTERYYVFRAK